MFIQNKIRANRMKLDEYFNKTTRVGVSVERVTDKSNDALKPTSSPQENNIRFQKQLGIYQENANGDEAQFHELNEKQFDYPVPVSEIQMQIANNKNALNQYYINNIKQAGIATNQADRLGVNRFLPPVNEAVDKITSALNEIYPELGLLTRPFFVQKYDPVILQSIAKNSKFFMTVIQDDKSLVVPPMLKIQPGETQEQYFSRVAAVHQQNLALFVDKCSSMIPFSLAATANLNSSQTASVNAPEAPALETNIVGATGDIAEPPALERASSTPKRDKIAEWITTHSPGGRRYEKPKGALSFDETETATPSPYRQKPQPIFLPEQLSRRESTESVASRAEGEVKEPEGKDEALTRLEGYSRANEHLFERLKNRIMRAKTKELAMNILREYDALYDVLKGQANLRGVIANNIYKTLEPEQLRLVFAAAKSKPMGNRAEHEARYHDFKERYDRLSNPRDQLNFLRQFLYDNARLNISDLPKPPEAGASQGQGFQPVFRGARRINKIIQTGAKLAGNKRLLF